MLPLSDQNYHPPPECPLPEEYRTTSPRAAGIYFLKRARYLEELERSNQAEIDSIEEEEVQRRVV
jgi:hypothetical protein